MPARSKAQNRFMQAVAHDPQFAAKVHVPQKVGQDFAAATKTTKGLPEHVAKKNRAKVI